MLLYFSFYFSGRVTWIYAKNIKFIPLLYFLILFSCSMSFYLFFKIFKNIYFFSFFMIENLKMSFWNYFIFSAIFLSVKMSSEPFTNKMSFVSRISWIALFHTIVWLVEMEDIFIYQHFFSLIQRNKSVNLSRSVTFDFFFFSKFSRKSGIRKWKNVLIDQVYMSHFFFISKIQ